MIERTRTVLALGSAQTLAWASSYYLPAMLAAPMARDLGIGTPTVFAVFSLALMVSAFTGPASGRVIDRHGGRAVNAELKERSSEVQTLTSEVRTHVL